MNLFYHYFLLQLKRMFKSFKAIFFTTVLLVLAISGLFVAQLKINSESPEKQKYNIGLVGNLNESYLGFGLDAIEKLDTSRFIIDFLEMSEADAQKAIANNSITAYIRIPDHFVDALIHGEDTRISFVCGSSQNTLGTEIVKELALSVSKIVTESQAALYTAYRVYDAESKEKYDRDLQHLNIQYFDLILGREKIYHIQCTGGTNGLSLEAYLLSAATIIFLLFWGITCSSLLTNKDLALPKLLAARGISAFKQCLGEFLAFYIFMCFNCYLIFTAILLFLKLGNIPIFSEQEANPVLQILKILWLIILCISSMTILIYHLSNSLNSGILMNFVLALIMGYFSGCFYPISYFPTAIQKISSILPPAISVNFLTNYLKAGHWGMEAFSLFIYAILFMTIAGFLRKMKLNQ